uniref:Abortive phage infection protein C-terminal domain-containing protein n=1 Tax=Candidatus Methanophagaceae archaeon ANME-1 ERB6 TaxID=2759912 RepID=A0A7G9Z1A3_9EURY|nr:hypothetical protein KFAGBJAM_00019 [Methanosarcinales archaeon ANME-1 ERB6]
MEFVSSRMQKIIHESASDQERSKGILQFYILEVLKLKLADPLFIEYSITDGPNDGGLDAYAIDSETDPPKLMLLQCKWFTDPKKISEQESLDLFNFVSNKLLKNERSGLNDAAKRLIGKYHEKFREAILEAYYISNGELNPNANKRYEELKSKGVEFFLVDQPSFERQYEEALSGEEPIANEIAFVLTPGLYFTQEIPLPKDLVGQERSNVLQFPIAGTDLRRAADLYARKLFIRNLRLGLKSSKINKQMKDTANGSWRRAFYILHNGISIICSDFKMIKLSDTESSRETLKKKYNVETKENIEYILDHFKEGFQEFVLLKDFQIVNGAQSTITLSEISDDKLPDISVPCKIAQSPSQKLAHMIAYCNNSQNKITPEDLVANSAEQTFLQSYAALEVEPAIFYRRKNGEKWNDLNRICYRMPPHPTPLKLRHLNYIRTYQAFLAFTGDPADAYSRPRALILPNTPCYEEISSYLDKEEILMAGLISNFEDKTKDSENDPQFTKNWKMWAIAIFGHIYRHHLDEAEKLKKKMLSEDGLNSWKEIRENIGQILKEIMRNYFPSVDRTGYHKFFKADEGVFDLKGFTRVTPHECARYMNPNVPKTALMEMKRAKVQHSINYYQVNFAVIAVLVDKQIANEQRVIENIRNLAK